MEAAVAPLLPNVYSNCYVFMFNFLSYVVITVYTYCVVVIFLCPLNVHGYLVMSKKLKTVVTSLEFDVNVLFLNIYYIGV
jgi:hypothetical protein